MDSEYLKNLQENVVLTESFVNSSKSLTEDEFKEYILEIGLYGDILYKIIQKLKHDPSGGLPDVGNIISKIAEAPATPHVLGAAIGIAAALYTRKLLQAKAACKNAPDKDKCKKEMKMKALQAKIAIIQAGKKKCTTSKCHNKADTKIASIKSKMQG